MASLPSPVSQTYKRISGLASKKASMTQDMVSQLFQMMSLQPFFFLGNSLFEPRDKLFFGSFSLILLDHTSSVFDIIRCKFRNFS
jgi:hypothetical protein